MGIFKTLLGGKKNKKNKASMTTGSTYPSGVNMFEYDYSDGEDDCDRYETSFESCDCDCDCSD